MPKIIFDTAVGSTNLGDHIIMDAVNALVEELFMDDFVINIATHQRIHPLDLPPLRKYDLALVGGTNLLKNSNIRGSQWQVGLKEIAVLKHKVVLLGVGWWQYQAEPVSAYTQLLYGSLLSKDLTHAVRDSYTKEKLASFGITNVINTGCPTAWGLSEAHCAEIPVEARDVVATTITDYLRDPSADKHLLETLKRRYKEVHVWIQGSKDLEYVKSLTDGLHFIAPKLSAFDRFLENVDCDYVGTRLHAGIRALQKKRRALIVGIDNRALEMQKDINLPVIDRRELGGLEERLSNQQPIRIQLDVQAIAKWKAQFQ